MIVNAIALENFRNYTEAEMEFGDKVNVITGDNAQGKTNLIEAIFYMTCGRSFRTRFDRDVIRFDADFAAIKARVISGGREQKLEAHLKRGGKKQFHVNGVRLKRASDLSGKMTAVLFCPDDLVLIKEGAAARRRFMDNCLCQLRPRYAAALSAFTKTYEQKTRILKDHFEKPSLLSLLEEYNEQLARLSAELIRYRAAFVHKLSPIAQSIHSDFSGKRECLTVEYNTVSTVEDPMRPVKDLIPQILEHQEKHRRAEIESGLCLTGAHKDDLVIQIGGREAKSFASQGQTRTAALSLKLAEREMHYLDRGEYPILLLDDVLSELDENRQNFVLNRIQAGQIFITGCEDGQIAQRTGGRVYRVSNGRID